MSINVPFSRENLDKYLIVEFPGSLINTSCII